MLPAAHRLRDGAAFGTTVRSGRRAGSRTLVVHCSVPADELAPGTADPLVGLVVSRAVGDAVTRNRVKRRLRHLAAARVERLPRGSTTVVRALPDSARASSELLAHDLDRCLDRCLGRVPTVPTVPA